jgi:hypothetical protein
MQPATDIDKKNAANGHALNVGSFFELINLCRQWGAYWRPAKEALQPNAMRLLQHQALSCLIALQVAQNSFEKAVQDRRQLFDNLKDIAQQLMQQVKTYHITGDVLRCASQLHQKLVRRGSVYLQTPPLDAGAAGLAFVVQAQQYYDEVAELLAQLARLLKAKQHGKAKMPATQASTLKAEAQQLLKANHLAAKAFNQWLHTCQQRDDLLYHPLQGMVAVARQVREHVKMMLGSRSKPYKQAVRLVFNGEERVLVK